MPKQLTTKIVIGLAVFGLANLTQIKLTGVNLVRADVFQMKDGRTIAGAAVFIPTRKAFLVEIAEEIKVLVPESQVAKHFQGGDRQVEYESKLAQMQDDLDGHAELAAWCKKSGMLAHEKAHYERMLDFDIDHAVARAALGYRRDKSNQWTRLDKVMSGQRGMIRDGSKWTFPELVAMRKQSEETEVAVKQRGREIRRWHNEALSNGQKSQAAILKLQQIEDPEAITELAALMRNTKTPEQLRLLYIQLLKKMQHPAATLVIAQTSILDGDGNIRNACLDALAGIDNGKETAKGIYLTFLQDKDPLRIDRAAEALGSIGDPSTVLPLIDALITSRTVTAPAGPGISTGMQNGNGGLSMGGRPKQVQTQHRSRPALAALTQLTGVNFEYDKNKWRLWYASKYAPPVDDLRRDP